MNTDRVEPTSPVDIPETSLLRVASESCGDAAVPVAWCARTRKRGAGIVVRHLAELMDHS
jgi:hypothetical protein